MIIPFFYPFDTKQTGSYADGFMTSIRIMDLKNHADDSLSFENHTQKKKKKLYLKPTE